MKINTSKFLMSNTKLSKCPKPDKPEYAFIGRSNVGKSSLINMLSGRKALAKISGKPGKTQLINHFLINESWYLVDLPGYGYAKIAKNQREKWMIFIMDYIKNRENLMCLFVLIDSRIEPQKIDLEFISMLGENGIPFNLIFTKTDKIAAHQIQINISAFNAKMLETWEDTPGYHISSARTGTGKEEILEFIDKTNQAY
ncbi:MAG: YihA family ribosome biogenesis GTP-binding protein [Bacteroidales bacterium]|nr:YihA family ribosome biogenesis GTP-binding protein [Bacteroidales bacterium]